jgi:plasmid stabilization system protein ParE
MMKVKWTLLAKDGLREIANYIKKNFGAQARMDFLHDVKHTNKLLGSQPYMGPIELTLDGHPEGFRSIVVHKLSKIIYYIDNDHIEVADFWNCRQAPENLANRIKTQC